MRGWRQIAMFAVVGTAGFVADVAVLYSVALVLNWYAARIVSFILAATLTWYLNRNSTFRSEASQQTAPSTWHKEWKKYLATVSAGAVVNYALYAGVIQTWNHMAAPGAGVALGSIGGMILNFLAVRRWVYR